MTTVGLFDCHIDNMSRGLRIRRILLPDFQQVKHWGISDQVWIRWNTRYIYDLIRRVKKGLVSGRQNAHVEIKSSHYFMV